MNSTLEKNQQNAEALARILGAVLTINENCVQLHMPQSKTQAKKGQNSTIAHFNYYDLSVNLEKCQIFMNEWREFWHLKDTIKKDQIKKFLKYKLLTSDKWALKALVLIYSYQTLQEQNTESTSVNNNVGFNGVHAKILSSFAKQYLERNWLSPKQMLILKKHICKYWHQIQEASDEHKLLRQVKAGLAEIAEKNVQQTTMGI